jgi:glycosyltransferase involved in cell wall biosynthesis
MPPGRRAAPHGPGEPLEILFVYSRDSTFVSIDRDLLARRRRLRPWPQPRALVNPLAVAGAVRRSDLVFGWFASWHTFWPVTFAWLLRRPSVVVIGGFDTAKLPEIGYGLQQRAVMGPVSRWVMRRATRLVTNSEYSRREIEANLEGLVRKVTVIHHGVPDPFGALPSSGRRRLALTVGIVDRRNLDRKGLLAFVRTAALLPDVEFVVAGKWEDDSVDELRAAASENVRITGWIEQSELEALYRQASVYVQASRHEGFGLSVAEAMLAGSVPVVSSAGALPEVVGDAGIVLDSHAPEPEELAEAIRRALAAGDTDRERARRRVLERFPVSARGEALEQVVEEALASGRRG